MFVLTMWNAYSGFRAITFTNILEIRKLFDEVPDWCPKVTIQEYSNLWVYTREKGKEWVLTKMTLSAGMKSVENTKIFEI